MTTREMMDSLSETLMCDERILSVPERELLANLLQHARTNGSTRDNAVAETIARTIGETIAQRAYGILGDSITQRLIEQASASASDNSGAHAIMSQSAPAPPKAPAPPTAPAPPKASGANAVMGAPAPPKAPAPPTAPAPPKAWGVNAIMGAPAPPKAPAPPTAPAPPKALGANAQAQSSQVAVLESAEFLPAHSVVLDEFLVPEELNELLQYTQEHEADFEISEVISPGARGTAIDYQHRRSRVLMSLDKHHEVLANRIQACMPRVLQKVGRDVFPVSQVEAQITASNHGDFFRQHSDNDQAPIASREVTFVYFFSP